MQDEKRVRLENFSRVKKRQIEHVSSFVCRNFDDSRSLVRQWINYWSEIKIFRDTKSRIVIETRVRWKLDTLLHEKQHQFSIWITLEICFQSPHRRRFIPRMLMWLLNAPCIMEGLIELLADVSVAIISHHRSWEFVRSLPWEVKRASICRRQRLPAGWKTKMKTQ